MGVVETINTTIAWVASAEPRRGPPAAGSQRGHPTPLTDRVRPVLGPLSGFFQRDWLDHSASAQAERAFSLYWTRSRTQVKETR